MKKIYNSPRVETVRIEGQAIMNIATSGNASLDTSDTYSIDEGDAWVKDSRGGSFDDEW